MHIRRSFTSERELKEIQDFIFEKSKEGKGFNGILEAAFNEVTVTTAIHNIKGNKGANTPGVDGNKMEKYLQMDRNKLMKLIHETINNYKPNPVRRVYSVMFKLFRYSKKWNYSTKCNIENGIKNPEISRTLKVLN